MIVIKKDKANDFELMLKDTVEWLERQMPNNGYVLIGAPFLGEGKPTQVSIYTNVDPDAVLKLMKYLASMPRDDAISALNPVKNDERP